MVEIWLLICLSLSLCLHMLRVIIYFFFELLVHSTLPAILRCKCNHPGVRRICSSFLILSRMVHVLYILTVYNVGFDIFWIIANYPPSVYQLITLSPYFVLLGMDSHQPTRIGMGIASGYVECIASGYASCIASGYLNIIIIIVIIIIIITSIIIIVVVIIIIIIIVDTVISVSYPSSSALPTDPGRLFWVYLAVPARSTANCII